MPKIPAGNAHMVTGNRRRVVLPAICECSRLDVGICRRIGQRIEILRVAATDGVVVDGGRGHVSPQHRDKIRECGDRERPKEVGQSSKYTGSRGLFHALTPSNRYQLRKLLMLTLG